MKMPTKSPIAFITGANRGLGFETARQLAQRGSTVIIGARNIEKGKHAAASLQQEGLEVFTVHCDVSSIKSREECIHDLVSRFGQVDILINNAGVLLDDGMTPFNISYDVVEAAFRTNLFGPMFLTQGLVPILEKGTNSRIINVSSRYGLTSFVHENAEDFPEWSGLLGYSPSKAAVNMWSLQLAIALKPKGIKVFSVAPGWVRTEMGGEEAFLSVEEGAKPIVRAALDEDGESGLFVLDERRSW